MWRDAYCLKSCGRCGGAFGQGTGRIRRRRCLRRHCRQAAPCLHTHTALDASTLLPSAASPADADGCVDVAPPGGACALDQCNSTAVTAPADGTPYCLKTCGRCSAAA